MLCIMAKRRVEIGPVGETVRGNVADLRKRRGLTLRDLSEKMTAAGRPMAYNTLSEIERGARRVDVDDLVALAVALGAPPIDLLGVPASTPGDMFIDATIDMLLNQVMELRQYKAKKDHPSA
jgi:transcriptional regulator with XRE-family HTH domain